MHRVQRPTIKDVAKAAGVSPTTVSHALNGKGVVRRETEERVRLVAAQIGYRPSAIARGLRSSRLGLMGLVIRPFASLDSFIPPGVDYFLRIAGFASLTAMEHGYSLMIADDPSKSGGPVSALAADAYVVTEPFENDPVLTLLDRERIPFVSIGSDPARPNSFVTIDTLAGEQTLEMMAHLTSAGAQRVALVTGTDRNAWNLDTQRAYRTWCEERGQEPMSLTVPEAEGEHAGDIVLDRFFGASDAGAPDAVYCLTGRHATGVATAAIQRGIDVPGQLLVAAGSGALQNQTVRPTVTAFDLQPERLAQMAVEYAVRLVERAPGEGPLRAPEAVLHVRESTSR